MKLENLTNSELIRLVDELQQLSWEEDSIVRTLIEQYFPTNTDIHTGVLGLHCMVLPIIKQRFSTQLEAISEVMEVLDGNGVPNTNWIKNKLITVTVDNRQKAIEWWKNLPLTEKQNKMYHFCTGVEKSTLEFTVDDIQLIWEKRN